MSEAEDITRHFGGDWNGRRGYGLFPTPGHSADDRGTKVLDAGAGRVIFHSYNGGDWRELQTECRRLGLLCDEPQRELSPAERRRREAEASAAREKRAAAEAAVHRAAATRAMKIWSTAAGASPNHPYLARKRLAPKGVRQAGSALLVPMVDVDGRLWNLQRITAAGRKLYLEDGRVKGLFFPLGSSTSTVCIGEGFATMAAVHEATGYAVAAAFTASNLGAVAAALKQRWPDADFVLCADDDAHLVENPQVRRNVGVVAAQAAAAAIGARLAVPGGLR